MKVQQSIGIIEYRSICWEILIVLASNPDWNDVILLFLDSYAQHLYAKPDYDIVYSEVKYVENLLEILKCDRISYLRTVKKIL